jgi:hypothetical protein
MARPHSTRRKAESSARPSNRLRNAAPAAIRARYRRSSRLRTGSRPSPLRRLSGNLQLIDQLRDLARLLRGVYSTCVTAELALRGQNADQDADIVCALRAHVSAPVSRQVEKIDALVVKLCGSTKGTLT